MSEFKNNEDVFAPSNTGTKAHAFLGARGAKPGNLRAACRVTIQRGTDATFVSLDRARKFYSVCDNCVKLYAEAEARAEASMLPATEAHDLGYVAPVDERTEVVPATEQKPAAEQHADLSAKDGTVTLNRDTLVRKGHWADVTLATGRTYSVSMLVHRATDPHVLVDHVIYWSERADRTQGPIRAAGADDKPGSVGGRIWALLVAANIAPPKLICQTCGSTGTDVATMDDPFTAALYPDENHEQWTLCERCAVARFEES